MREDLKATAILSLVAFFVMLGVGIIAPVLPIYALSFGVSYAAVGGLVAAFAVARVLLDIPAGMLASRFGLKRFMLIGLAIIAASSLVAAFATGYAMLLTARILEGVGSAMYTTVSMTAVSMSAPTEARGKHLSIYMSMFLLGSLAGPAIGGFLAQSIGLGGPFLVYGACGGMSALLVLAFVREPPRSAEGAQSIRLSQLTRLIRKYDVISVNMGTFAVFVARQGVLTTLVSLYAVNNIGMTSGDLGVALTLSAGCNLVSMILSGRYSDRHGRRPLMMASLTFSGLIAIAIPFAHDMPTLCALVAGLGFSLGLTGPIAAWVTDLSEPSDLGANMGLFRTVGDTGFVIAPIALGALAGQSGQAVSSLPFLVAGAVVLLLCLPLARTSDPAAARGRR